MARSVGLTDAKVRNARAGKVPQKLPDSGGLYLHVTPAGSKIWRCRYTLAGKGEQTLTVGHYPALSLSEARTARDKAKVDRQRGIDPRPARDTFEQMARAWHTLQVGRWTKVHASDVLGSLEAHVFPTLGAIPTAKITPKIILDVLREIEARPAIETAHRVRQRMSAVFQFAIANDHGSTDPAAVVQPALAHVVKRRQPAVVEIEALREVLKKAEAVPAHPTTRLALRLLALTAVRPGELRGAEVGEFDGDTWTIPARRMKMKVEHSVPLSTQAVEVVELARGLVGTNKLLFPSTRHAHHPISENAIGYLLNRAGYHGHHVPHGFRAAFSTIMNERYRADRLVIDLMLAHAQKDRVEGAYNRAVHMERRRELAQAWADLLLEGAVPAGELMALPRR